MDAGRGREVVLGLYSDRLKDKVMSGYGREGDGGGHLGYCSRLARGIDLPCCPGRGGGAGGGGSRGWERP